MTNEEFQKIVLEKFNSLEAGQQQLTEKVGMLEKRQQSLEKGQKEIRKELGFVWEDIKRIDKVAP